jgi:hypothetical protein
MKGRERELSEIARATLADIQAIEQTRALYEEASFGARVAAIDRIEFHVLDRIAGLQGRHPAGAEWAHALQERAEQLRDRLEALNQRLFEGFRARIRSGSCSGARLRRQLERVAGSAPDRKGQDEPGYDTLDLFVNGLLCVDAAPGETRAREPEMVFYQPTPARVVLELVERAGLGREDVFYDLGSGLGQVAILVGLLSQARVKGIEFEPAYCSYAQRCASGLNVPRVEFINVDARHADYADGTIFFLYTPFEGQLLGEVLDKLRVEPLRRPVRVYTYGPCTLEVCDQGWLRCLDRDALQPYRLAAFTSSEVG